MERITKKEIVSIVKDVGIYVITKISYPVLGNLSYRVQEGLQNKLGKDVYDAEKAYDSSAIAGVLTTGVLGAITGGLEGASPSGGGSGGDIGCGIIMGAVIGTVLGSIYQAVRNDVVNADYGASLIGKIVSLPIEGLMNLKERADYVKNRIKSKKSLEYEVGGEE